MIHAPVLHVNGDYPEGQYPPPLYLLTRLFDLELSVWRTSDVTRAVETAFKYRNHFRKVQYLFLYVLSPC